MSAFLFLLLSIVLFFFYVNESKGASFSHMPIDKQVSEESEGGRGGAVAPSRHPLALPLSILIHDQ